MYDFPKSLPSFVDISASHPFSASLLLVLEGPLPSPPRKSDSRGGFIVFQDHSTQYRLLLDFTLYEISGWNRRATAFRPCRDFSSG